jgi:hypothetical protein
LLLRTLQAPPSRGSLQEWCLIFLLERLEDIEHAKFRALAQLNIDAEEGAKAFEDYLTVAFPSLALRRKKQSEENKRVLDWWTSFKSIEVTPLVPPTIKSKVNARKMQGPAHQKANDIYNRIRR